MLPSLSAFGQDPIQRNPLFPRHSQLCCKDQRTPQSPINHPYRPTVITLNPPGQISLSSLSLSMMPSKFIDSQIILYHLIFVPRRVYVNPFLPHVSPLPTSWDPSILLLSSSQFIISNISLAIKIFSEHLVHINALP